jgi:hypothetical protein
MDTKQKVSLFLDHPIEESFQKICHDELGLSLVYAILWRKSKLTKFFKTFEDWEWVFHNCNGKLKKTALKNLRGFEKSFEDWRCVYTQKKGCVKEMAFQKMLRIMRKNC